MQKLFRFCVVMVIDCLTALLLSFIPTADDEEYCIGEELSMNIVGIVPYAYCLRKPPRPGLLPHPGYLYLSQSIATNRCFSLLLPTLSCVSVIYKSRNERPLIFGTTIRKFKRYTIYKNAKSIHHQEYLYSAIICKKKENKGLLHNHQDSAQTPSKLCNVFCRYSPAKSLFLPAGLQFNDAWR